LDGKRHFFAKVEPCCHAVKLVGCQNKPNAEIISHNSNDIHDLDPRPQAQDVAQGMKASAPFRVSPFLFLNLKKIKN